MPIPNPVMPSRLGDMLRQTLSKYMPTGQQLMGAGVRGLVPGVEALPYLDKALNNPDVQAILDASDMVTKGMPPQSGLPMADEAVRLIGKGASKVAPYVGDMAVMAPALKLPPGKALSDLFWDNYSRMQSVANKAAHISTKNEARASNLADEAVNKTLELVADDSVTTNAQTPAQFADWLMEQVQRNVDKLHTQSVKMSEATKKSKSGDVVAIEPSVPAPVVGLRADEAKARTIESLEDATAEANEAVLNERSALLSKGLGNPKGKKAVAAMNEEVKARIGRPLTEGERRYWLQGKGADVEPAELQARLREMAVKKTTGMDKPDELHKLSDFDLSNRLQEMKNLLPMKDIGRHEGAKSVLRPDFDVDAMLAKLRDVLPDPKDTQMIRRYMQGMKPVDAIRGRYGRTATEADKHEGLLRLNRAMDFMHAMLKKEKFKGNE